MTISDSDWAEVFKKFQTGSCSKNDVLTAHNKVENSLYFLSKGVVRLYYEFETKDVTVNFGFPQNFISSYSSFLSRNKSEFILEALTDCEFVSITHGDLEALYTSTSCGHQMGRILTENMFIYLSQRENSFLLKSPTQRYLDLFTEQPRLVQEIPQKYLASYIGITPQALSRIRAKISE